MNAATEEKYYQAGQLLASLQGKRRLSELESALIRALTQSSPSFRNSLKLLKQLNALESPLTISEVADLLGFAKKKAGKSESATVVIRALRESVLQFDVEGGTGGIPFSIGYSIPGGSVLSVLVEII